MRTFLISISLIIFSFTKAYTQNYNVEAYKFHKSISEAQQNIGKEIYYFNNRATDLNLKILKFYSYFIYLLKKLKSILSFTSFIEFLKNLFIK